MIPVRPENGAAVVRFRKNIFADFGAPARCVAEAAEHSCSSNRPKSIISRNQLVKMKF